MNRRSLNNCIRDIITYQEQSDKTIQNLINHNSDLIKLVANIRTTLERCLRRPGDLNNAVYQCIDLCRENFVYMDYTSGKNKKDPPLTDAEKTLPQYNLE